MPSQVIGWGQGLFIPSNRLSLIYAVSALSVLVACGGSGDTLSPTPSALTLSKPANYVLKWSDDFNMAGALSSAWTYDLGSPVLDGGGVWGNNERQFYTSDSSNVFVSNGLLTIQPARIDPTIAPIRTPSLLATSSRVKTDTDAYYDALNGTPYGYYEIMAKVPCVGGAWPAIWMMGKSGDWPARGEVDIMEWFGKWLVELPYENPDQVQSAVHTASNNWLPNSPGRPLYAKRSVENMCGEFHRFQLHWTASEMVMGVNDVPTLSYRKPKNANEDNWPFDQSAYLILNVAVGGNLGGAVDVNDLPAMNMQVDYVQVWQTP